MEKRKFQEVELLKIGRCPWQPRRRFEGPKFDEMVASVKEKGVIEPVLLRPLPKAVKESFEGFPTCGMKVDHQLIAGERRYRAACVAASSNGGLKGATIPAIVQDLDDDAAFDLMTIENYHREDLNEREEAENFRSWVERRGEDTIAALAERIGVSSRYVRRRLRLLRLPAKILETWGDGKISYGYLEQLLRLNDEKLMLEIFSEIMRGHFKWQRVRDLKNFIDERSPGLNKGRFRKDECKTCQKNTDVQKELFGIVTDMKGAHCMDPDCYKQKQGQWFTENWEKTSFHEEYHTTGYRFREDFAYGHWEAWYSGKPKKKCTSCESFVTLLSVEGKKEYGIVCIGSKDCFRKSKKEGSKKTKRNDDGSIGENAPRVSWHGEHFREAFYREQLPLRLAEIPPEDEKALRVMLYALIDSEQRLQGWFSRKHGVKDNFDPNPTMSDEEEDDRREREANQGWGYCFLQAYGKLITVLEAMTREQLLKDLREASTLVLLKKANPEARDRFAAHIGIDLEKEWRITPEYLEKKAVAEIHAIAEDPRHKLWERKETKAFLFEVLLKKRDSFRSCKKSELVRLILESGVDLAGVVPEEIREGRGQGSEIRGQKEASICDDAAPECKACKAAHPVCKWCCKDCTDGCGIRQECRFPF